MKINNKTKKVVAFVEIALMISMSFAIAFIMQENSVSAGNPPTTLTTPGFVTKANYEISMAGGSHGLIPAESTVTASTPVSGGYNIAYTTSSGDMGTQFLSTEQYQGLYPGTGSAPGWDPKHPIKGIYGGQALGGGVAGSLLAGVAWAATAYLLVKMLGGLLKLDEGTQKALETSVTAGTFVYGTLKAMTTNSVNLFGAKSGIFSTLQANPFWTGLGIAAIIFILTYSSEKKKMVDFQCLPFEPPLSGQNCEQCNKDPLRPCSEYRCKSLGQGCELLNANTAEEQCAWVSRNDVTSPMIILNSSMLYPDKLNYKPDTAIRPPSIGTKIVSENGGCLSAFTPLEFGFNTNEPAQCKIDYNHTNRFDEMAYYVGDTNYYSYSHLQKMRLPGPNTGNNSAAPLLQNDGNFALYVRCRDYEGNPKGKGNENVDEYAFTFCVDAGPDTTPPLIEEFSIPTNSYVTYNVDNVPIEVYVNEPSECKWSRDSKAYEDMENSMRCFTESYQVNANLQYTCSGNLTGVENRQDNTFYFRCKDQPNKPDNERNVNVQSTPLVLKGSQPLNIITSLPNKTIIGSTDVVPLTLEVETDDGAEEGKATCYFSDTKEISDYIKMFETGSYYHKQKLNLVNGPYTFYFRCLDAGGNIAENNVSFNVLVDKQAPRVTRVYKQEALKIVTDEDAECSYSISSCNFIFEEGIKLLHTNPEIKDNLYAEWKSGAYYYIKCKDSYNNEPSPNECSIVASAIELSK